MTSRQTSRVVVVPRLYWTIAVLLVVFMNLTSAVALVQGGKRLKKLQAERSEEEYLNGRLEASRAIGDCDGNICKYDFDKSQPPKCYVEVGKCLDLECVPDVEWYRNPDGNNTYLGNFFKPEDPTNYEINKKVNNISRLQILKARAIDYGPRNFRAIEYSTKRSCYFDNYVYDKTNYYGSLTIEGDTFALDQSSSLNFRLTSFSNAQISYVYRFEALPLDRLVVNNQIVKSSPCDTTRNLKCLQSNDTSLSIKKCVDNYTLTFSYFFDDPDGVLATNYSVTARTLTKYINFTSYPPQTTDQTSNIFFAEVNKAYNLTLQCKVDCGLPNLYTYVWTNTDGSEIKTIVTTDTVVSISYAFTPSSQSDRYEILCNVSNGVQPSNYAESQTRFVIAYQSNPQTTTTTTIPLPDINNGQARGLEPWQTALIVIGAILLFLLCCLLLLCLLICLRRRRRKDEVYHENKNSPPSSDYDLTERNSPANEDLDDASSQRRQRVLTEELSANPIYGTSRVVITQQQGDRPIENRLDDSIQPAVVTSVRFF